MKIYPSLVSTIKINNNQTLAHKQKQDMGVVSEVNYQSVPFLGSGYYVGFKGNQNASLNLEQTMDRLYEAEALKGEKIIPERIREATDFVLEGGNPNKLALIDVHKQIYEDVLYSDSLDEVKKKYPEFDDVISINDIEKRKKSFISDIKSGENKLFSPDEDFALQLLKLYWAEAYSISDIEKYIDAKTNAYELLKDLNIPRRHPHYALRLKLSDSEYNERFIETLKLRHAQRIEKETGGVYIPRGALSSETKMKISEGLLEYYSKNPERIYLQSARQREFFSNNPEIAGLFREVLFDAWRLSSSKPVKASMKSFYEKKRFEQRKQQQAAERFSKLRGQNNMLRIQKEIVIPTDKELSDVKRLGSTQRNLMQEFWDNNPDAKRLFGRSLQCAWNRVKKVKAAESNLLVLENGLPAYPKKLADRMRAWTIAKGYDADSIKLNMCISVGNFNKGIANKSMGAKLVTEYFAENPMMSDIYADSLAYALGELKQYLVSHRSNGGDATIQKIETAAKGRTFLYLNELSCLYLDVVQLLIKNGNVDALTKLIISLEASYDEVIKWRKSSGMELP